MSRSDRRTASRSGGACGAKVAPPIADEQSARAEPARRSLGRRAPSAKQVSAIDTERALLAPERLSQVATYALEHFAQKTKGAQHYAHAGKRVNSLHALFATASIDAAKRYYAQFKGQQQDLTPDRKLKVGIIYSYAANEDVGGDYLDEEGFETGSFDQSSRDFLEDTIKDYNAIFGTSFDTTIDKFQNYYKDLSLRLKNREIDLVIVVNMFLTRFDATTLNAVRQQAAG